MRILWSSSGLKVHAIASAPFAHGWATVDVKLVWGISNIPVVGSRAVEVLHQVVPETPFPYHIGTSSAVWLQLQNQVVPYLVIGD